MSEHEMTSSAAVAALQHTPDDTADRATKLFIGGISRRTTTKHLRDHFAKCGRVLDCVAMRQPDGRPRGFGYVTLDTPEAAEHFLKEAQSIDERIVDVKLAVPDTEAQKPKTAVDVRAQQLSTPDVAKATPDAPRLLVDSRPRAWTATYPSAGSCDMPSPMGPLGYDHQNRPSLYLPQYSGLVLPQFTAAPWSLQDNRAHAAAAAAHASAYAAAHVAAVAYAAASWIPPVGGMGFAGLPMATSAAAKTEPTAPAVSPDSGFPVPATLPGLSSSLEVSIGAGKSPSAVLSTRAPLKAALAVVKESNSESRQAPQEQKRTLLNLPTPSRSRNAKANLKLPVKHQSSTSLQPSSAGTEPEAPSTGASSAAPSSSASGTLTLEDNCSSPGSTRGSQGDELEMPGMEPMKVFVSKTSAPTPKLDLDDFIKPSRSEEGTERPMPPASALPPPPGLSLPQGLDGRSTWPVRPPQQGADAAKATANINLFLATDPPSWDVGLVLSVSPPAAEPKHREMSTQTEDDQDNMQGIASCPECGSRQR